MEYNESKKFLEALIFIASVDGKIDDSERGFFQEVADELGISSDEISEMCAELEAGELCLEDILSQIETEEAKLSLLRMLVDLCHVDGKYSSDEKKGMVEICHMLDIDEKELKKIEKEQWSKESKEAFKKGFNAIKSGIAFAGEKSVEGGKFVASGIAGGVGKVSSKLSDAVASAKKLREENKKLRDELEKTTISESVKQKIILQLNTKITTLTTELNREKARNRQNEEMIQLLTAQLEDLEKTIEVAEAAKTA